MSFAVSSIRPAQSSPLQRSILQGDGVASTSSKIYSVIRQEGKVVGSVYADGVTMCTNNFASFGKDALMEKAEKQGLSEKDTLELYTREMATALGGKAETFPVDDLPNDTDLQSGMLNILANKVLAISTKESMQKPFVQDVLMNRFLYRLRDE